MHRISGNGKQWNRQHLLRHPYLIDDLIISAGLLVTGLFCFTALRSVGVADVNASSYLGNLTLYTSALVTMVAVEILWLLAKRRPDRPLRLSLFYLKGRPHLKTLPAAIPILLALVIFMPLFSAMKSSIPLFNDYKWDSTWIWLDRSIHGNDPWRLLQPVFGHPAITALIAALYHLWILLIYLGSMFFALYVTDKELRRRYFVSFFAIWIVIGVVLATCLASVGPCFVGRMLGNPYYDAQLAYLRFADTKFPIMVLEVQDQLVAWKASGSHDLGRGITAMPSMHVALAFLFFLAMRKVSRKAGWFFGAFFVVILIGSVHLGYHYAVDGYVSILVTLLIWKIAGLWPAHEEATRPIEAAAARRALA